MKWLKKPKLFLRPEDIGMTVTGPEELRKLDSLPRDYSYFPDEFAEFVTAILDGRVERRPVGTSDSRLSSKDHASFALGPTPKL